jgi:hypothetical protein
VQAFLRSYIFSALDCHQVDESKNPSSGLEAKTCYRGERIPAIGDGWFPELFLLHCVYYRHYRRFMLMTSLPYSSAVSSAICARSLL